MLPISCRWPPFWPGLGIVEPIPPVSQANESYSPNHVLQQNHTLRHENFHEIFDNNTSSLDLSKARKTVVHILFYDAQDTAEYLGMSNTRPCYPCLTLAMTKSNKP